MFRKQNTATATAYSSAHPNEKLMGNFKPLASHWSHRESAGEDVSKKRNRPGGHDGDHKSTRIEIESARSVVKRAKSEPETAPIVSPAPDAPVKILAVPSSVSVREWKQEHAPLTRRRRASDSIMRAVRSVMGEPESAPVPPAPLDTLDIMLARVAHELEFIITYSADAIARNCALRAHSDISRWRTEQERG